MESDCLEPQEGLLKTGNSYALNVYLNVKVEKWYLFSARPKELNIVIDRFEFLKKDIIKLKHPSKRCCHIPFRLMLVSRRYSQ